MLKKFSVKGFKGFSKELIFDLSNPNDYQFNKHLIKSGIVKHSLVYGKNATGKTNLGLALFDLVFHLTDIDKNQISKYTNYLNLDSANKYAEFSYVFEFDGKTLIYNYKKSDIEKLLFEEIVYEGTTLLQYDFSKSKDKIINIESAKTLNWKYINEDMSAVKYIINNSTLKTNDPLRKFIDFVKGMLWFRNVENNAFIGLKNSSSNKLSDIIIENDKLEDFQLFLHDRGIDYNLFKIEDSAGKNIGIRFNNGNALFINIASTGTKSLWLFYCWKIFFKNVTFLFIDEFDANYHFDLSADMINYLNYQTNLQSVVTSHNTSLLSNKLTRPDCAFIISENNILNLSSCTDKELREAHNIEKLYREGHFTE